MYETVWICWEQTYDFYNDETGKRKSNPTEVGFATKCSSCWDFSRFINGKSYMEAIAKALLTAEEEVFISGWWLSPEVMMIRPAEDDAYRLDNLLGRIAVRKSKYFCFATVDINFFLNIQDNGVRVFVLVLKELSPTLGLNSLHTERALIGKSKKGFIKVNL